MRRLLALPLLLALFIPSLPARVGPPPAKPQPPSPRLMKLRMLTYDRRPSAMLKAWAPQVAEKKDDKKEPDPIDVELKALQRHVTLGQWAEVKAYFAKLTEEESKAGFEQMLRSLAMGPVPMRPGMPGGPEGLVMMGEMGSMPGGMPPGGAMAYAEKNQFAPDDLVGIAGCAPRKLEKSDLSLLGTITRQAVSSATVVEAIVRRFKDEAGKPKGALTRRQAAVILVQAGEADHVGELLPSLADARKAGDLQGLNLLARHYLARHDKGARLTLLEQAWEATQSALAVPVTPETQEEQEEALIRAVDLAPRLKENVGQEWLAASFAKEPARGMLILATIGTLSSKGLQMQAQDAAARHKVLKLQKIAVEAMLARSPRMAKEWRETLSLLASNWQREADVSYKFAENNKARLRRDRYGNIFWFEEEFFYNRRPMSFGPKPIDLTDVLEVRPGPAWLAAIRDDLRPKLAIVLCQLHLKADEEADAFPYIEDLARTHRGQAKELAREFLRVWTTNHDMNDAKRRTNPYYYIYGFERRSDGIPLTRSKQERNLVELAGWVAKLKKLEPQIGELDEELLARAFTACHSSAEVYRSEAVEKVFGPIGGLKPKTLSGLAQQMRENLAGVWRRPAEQQDKKTNRKNKDIEQEVLRGYAVGRKMVDDALVKFPNDWSLVLARAALAHDEVSFQQELKKDTSFAPRRNEAYALFRRAAELYASVARDLPEDEQSTRPYEQWFYASLGAVDLGQVSEEKVPDERQHARIKEALARLPGELADRHRERFANTLFNRMSGVRPQVKFRYLKGGFAIVGDHKAASEAKKLYEYYRDLVTEIQLVAAVDGPADVGHKRPFGVYVSLRHTRDIERESGGFGRYLQNQNTSTYFSWNYGRPTADYRDRFTETVKNALKEHFEVLSVTFETDKVRSRAEKEYGWRVTPYAYLLLKARGPQVDRLPPIRLDLDFLDTTGYVVLPVETATVVLDARSATGAGRPARNVKVTQILDERQANDGKLIVEVKASADGLVPELDELIELKPEGFEVVKTDDQGVAVSRFQQETDTITIASERTWLVTLQATTTTPPKSFRFGTSRFDGAKMVYQRYDDADMMAATEVMDLEATYAKQSRAWVWWLIGGAAGVLLAGGVLVAVLARPRKQASSKWQVPRKLTPFSAIALLERIRDEGGLDEPGRAEIRQTIERVERHYFGATNGEAVDLGQLTAVWVGKAR